MAWTLPTPVRFSIRATGSTHGSAEMARKGFSRCLTLRFLAVLTVVHSGRDGTARVISFRRASHEEREVYDAWLENECDEA